MKSALPCIDDSMFNDSKAIIDLAQRSFARAAVAENDRLGIRTCGSINGVIVYRDIPEPP